ncbi:MAG: TIR domain-containing protein [Hyalangium sp.]|uniref:TIR domain-containing protein n=1 Tax=Hyalangium sp. TaxID=2028555 RepID=UPI003899D2C5
MKDAGLNAAIGTVGGAALGLVTFGPFGLLVGGLLGAGATYAVHEAKHSKTPGIAELPEGKIPTFISFAFEDSRMRDLFVGQSRNPNTPWDIADHSAHEPFSERWKSQMRLRILRSKVVILLVGAQTYASEGAIWEVETGLELGIPAFGVWLSREARGKVPSCLKPENIIDWTWEGISHMIRWSATLKQPI